MQRQFVFFQFATQMFVKNPKGSLYRFSGDGKYLAVIERMECNDYVAVLSTRTWKLTSHFKLPTIDAAGFEWVSLKITFTCYKLLLSMGYMTVWQRAV